MTDTFEPLSDEERDAINSAHIESEFYTPDNYYLDLCLLKDFRFAATMSLITELPREEGVRAHKVLMSHLKQYDGRSYDSVLMTVPDLPFTDADIDARMADPKYAFRLLRMAPVTTLLDTLSAHLIINANHSAVAEKYQKIPVGEDKYIRRFQQITFHINFHPLVPDQNCRDFVAAFFMDRYHVDVKFCDIKPREFTRDIFDLCDEFYVKSLWDFLESPWIQENLKPIVYCNKSVISSPLFPRDKSVVFPTHVLRKERRMLEAYLNTFVKFHWIEPRMYALVPHIPEPEKDADNGG